MTERRLLAAALLHVTMVLSVSSNAHAREGALRLGLEGNVVAYEKATLSVPDAAGGGKLSSSTTSVGLPASGLGLSLGYGATANLFLGGRLLVASDSTDVEGASVTQKRLLLLPHLEYLFSGRSTRAFLAANLGYSSIASSAEGSDASTSLFLIGPGVGIRNFVAPGLSLDAGLTALLTTGTSKRSDIELGTGGHSILLSVAVSGWFGGAEAPAAAEGPSVQRSAASAESPGAARLAIDDDALKTTFALDLPGAVGGVNVLSQGTPKRDPAHVQATVAWLEAEDRGAACEPVAFEVDGHSASLSSVRSSSWEGFGSARTIQRGELPAAVLLELARAESEAWLLVCGERIRILPAAKNRLARFASAFVARGGASPSEQPANTTETPP